MHKPLLLTCLMLIATPALAQTPRLYATGAEIAAAIATAKAGIKPDQALAVTPVLSSGPYESSLEYRQAATKAAIHNDQVELFQVVEGSGTLITGGTMAGTGAGATVDGGEAHHLAAGDTFIVPEKTPHWFNRIDGHLAVISIKMPAGGHNSP